tara:strand:+ start:760 stop:2193 length:1434 start_codon:yes stop_codon:yes gene_type:complete
MQSSSVSFSLILSTLFIVAGCHNNAHIRTQKPLKNGETVYSSSSTIPLSIGDPNTNLGIIGMRQEFSILKGIQGNKELGAYAAFGAGESSFGGVLGFDFKKHQYIQSSQLTKLGGRIELNMTEYGSVLNLRPSITTTTSQKDPFYLGLHGIFATPLGTLERPNYYSLLEYDFTSVGPGVTIGGEYFTQKSSFQLQLDVSYVSDRYNWISYRDWYDGDDENRTYLLVSASAGWNFFQKFEKNDNLSAAPFPPVKKTQPNSSFFSNNLLENFDPNTGERINKKRPVFDPETGEELKPEDHSYNPETGLNSSHEREVQGSLSKEIDKKKPQETSFEKKNKSPIGLSASQIINLANTRAEQAHLGPAWGLCGFAGVAPGFVGGIAGGIFTSEATDNGLGFFPGMLVGGTLGLSIFPTLAGSTANAIQVVYPNNVSTPVDQTQYRKAYIKRSRQLRMRSAWNGTALTMVTGAMGLVLLISAF